MFEDLEPIIVHSITAILAVLVPLLTQWLRMRTRRLVVEQAATEAEGRGMRESLSGEQKKTLAMSLAGERLGLWTKMSDQEVDDMIEAALPHARVSARPPPKP